MMRTTRNQQRKQKSKNFQFFIVEIKTKVVT